MWFTAPSWTIFDPPLDRYNSSFMPTESHNTELSVIDRTKIKSYNKVVKELTTQEVDDLIMNGFSGLQTNKNFF